jgi:hypothetical protein
MAAEDDRADDRARLSVVRQAQLQVARAALAVLRRDHRAAETYLKNAQQHLLTLEADLRAT